MARIKYSKNEKLAILAFYEDGHHSIADIMAKFSVDPGTIRDWKKRLKSIRIQDSSRLIFYYFHCLLDRGLFRYTKVMFLLY